MSTSYNLELANRISKRAAAITPLFTKMRRVAADRQIAFPMSVQVFPSSLVAPPTDTVNSLAIGGIFLDRYVPPASNVLPKGVQMSLTEAGDVIIDDISTTPPVVRRLSDTRVTYVAGTFTAKDLENILRTLDDVHAQLRDFQMAYGHSTPVQWIIDHLGTEPPP